jgi:K+-sensing histidine kinase KdpD
LRISKKPCDLRDLIGACLEQLKDKIGSRDIKIDIPKDFPEIAVDFPFILKASFNISDNALKYSPDGTPVEICVTIVQRKAQVKIQDYGLGIPKEDLKRIFEKFYRVERSQNVLGTGLGLWSQCIF